MYQEKFKLFFTRKWVLPVLVTVFFFILIIFILFVSSQRKQTEKIAVKKNTEKKFSLYPKTEYVKDHLIVKFKDGYGPDDITDTDEKRKILQKLLDAGVEHQEKLYRNETGQLDTYYILYLQEGNTLQQVGETVNGFDEIESVEGDAIVKFDAIPNDSSYQVSQWNMQKIGMEEAWEKAKGSKNIIVAVVDTGIDYTHEDLPTDIIKGADVTNQEYWGDGRDPMDDNGHGTMIAGIIGAVTDNAKGVSGMNWNVRLMAVQASYRNLAGNLSEMLQGVKYAADNGAKVINLSAGLPGRCSSTVQEVIDYVFNKNIVLVISAGNDNSLASYKVPANCEHVITVGATGRNDERARNPILDTPFSNYGPEVDLSAPGAEIYSTYSTRSWSLGGIKYFSWEGTSFSAPHVAGAAALLLSLNPYLTPTEVESCLVRNADTISTDEPIGPRLNVARVLNDSSCTVSRITPTPTPTMGPTNTPTPTLSPGYECVLPPGTSNKKALQLINLICTPGSR